MAVLAGGSVSLIFDGVVAAVPAGAAVATSETEFPYFHFRGVLQQCCPFPATVVYVVGLTYLYTLLLIACFALGVSFVKTFRFP